MNRTIPVRDEVIYLGNDVTVDSAISSPVQDVPPLEIVGLDLRWPGHPARTPNLGLQIVGLDT